MTKQNKFLPVFLATDKNKILLVGAGNVAMAKLSLIAEFSDNITIVAKKINHSVRELAKLRSFELIEANFDKSQLKDKKIVIAATNNEEVNQEIAKQAKPNREDYQCNTSNKSNILQPKANLAPIPIIKPPKIPATISLQEIFSLLEVLEKETQAKAPKITPKLTSVEVSLKRGF